MRQRRRDRLKQNGDRDMVLEMAGSKARMASRTIGPAPVLYEAAIEHGDDRE